MLKLTVFPSLYLFCFVFLTLSLFLLMLLFNSLSLASSFAWEGQWELVQTTNMFARPGTEQRSPRRTRPLAPRAVNHATLIQKARRNWSRVLTVAGNLLCTQKKKNTRLATIAPCLGEDEDYWWQTRPALPPSATEVHEKSRLGSLHDLRSGSGGKILRKL